LFENSIIEEAWDRTRGKCMICGKTGGKEVQREHGK
jgi:hypothetical protein